jgi:hypothetical protein
MFIHIMEVEKKYAHALDNYGQICFVRSDFLKMKCVCKTQMMPPPDQQNPVDMHTSIMCINILQNIEAVAPKPCIYIRTDKRTNGRTDERTDEQG